MNILWAEGTGSLGDTLIPVSSRFTAARQVDEKMKMLREQMEYDKRLLLHKICSAGRGQRMKSRWDLEVGCTFFFVDAFSMLGRVIPFFCVAVTGGPMEAHGNLSFADGSHI